MGKVSVLEDVLAHVRAGWPVDLLMGRVAHEVRQKVPAFLAGWEAHPTFAGHLPVLRRAVDHFLAGDHLSCVGLLFPRIEGLLRSNHAAGPGGKAGQKALSVAAVRPKIDRDSCPLLPRRFQQYLQEMYFADFDPADPDVGVSRNSVGHGVARADRFDEKAAVIGLLVAQQLFFFFEKPSDTAVRASVAQD